MMRVHILPMTLALSLLTACDIGSEAATEANFAFQTIELAWQGGDACKENADSDESAVDDNAEESLCATVRFSYPQLSSEAKPEAAAAINDLIRRELLDQAEPLVNNQQRPTTQEALKAFADDFIQEFSQDENAFTDWSIERSASLVYASDVLLTFLFEESGYTGGAHPYSGARYFVLDAESGEILHLADLLNTGYETPLNIEGEKAFRAARGLTEASSLDEAGFIFDNNVFALNNNFGVTQNGLVFYFNSYEIAPYAMGPTQIKIPYEDFQSLIRPDGLLSTQLES